MRRLLTGMLVVSLLGLLGSLAVVSVGPMLDEHWQTVGVTRATSPAGSIAGLLRRAGNAGGPGGGAVAVPRRAGHRRGRVLARCANRAPVRPPPPRARRRARELLGGHVHDADELAAVPSRHGVLRPL